MEPIADLESWRREFFSNLQTQLAPDADPFRLAWMTAIWLKA